MTLQVLLGLCLLIQLLLQAVPLVLQLAQLGGHIELLPGFFLEQLLQRTGEGFRDPPQGRPYPGAPSPLKLWQDTHLGVLELGPKGRYLLGQLDGLPLGLSEHARDTFHFILRETRAWLVETSRNRASLKMKLSFLLHIHSISSWDQTWGVQ